MIGPTGWVQGYGLTILSDWPVPGAVIAEPEGEPDLRITASPETAMQRAGDPQYEKIGDAVAFRAKGTATYICRNDAIEIIPEMGCDHSAVTALLIATALPAVLWMRGEVVLHAAAAVRAPGEPALLLCGGSGAGKSTVTAQLLAEGGALLADDSVRLSHSLVASGLAGGYHLAAEQGAPRIFHPLAAARAVPGASIRAIVMLSQDGDGPGLERLDRVAALAALLANQHRPAVPALLGNRGSALATLAILAQNCPVYGWRRPAIALSTAEREMLAREDLW